MSSNLISSAKMTAIYILFLILFLLILDFIIAVLRLKVSDMVKGYRTLFSGVNNYKHRIGVSFHSNSLKKILIIGDSTAVGSVIDPMYNIGGRLYEKYKVDVTNISINGAKTDNVINQLNNITDKKYYLIIIFIGNNDVSRFTDLDKIGIDMSKVLDKAKTISDKVIVFRGGNFGTIPMFPYIMRLIYGLRSRKIRKIFIRIAKEKSVIYVEKFMTYRNDIFLKDPYHYYGWDLLHLNESGYKVWFDYLVEEMEKNDVDLN